MEWILLIYCMFGSSEKLCIPENSEELRYNLFSKANWLLKKNFAHNTLCFHLKTHTQFPGYQ